MEDKNVRNPFVARIVLENLRSPKQSFIIEGILPVL